MREIFTLFMTLSIVSFVLLGCGQNVSYKSNNIVNPTTEPISENEVITINNGAALTTTHEVTLTLSPTIDAKEMCFRRSSDPYFGALDWQPFSSVETWSLDFVEGTKEVFIKFKDEKSNIYGPFSDSIIFDRYPGEVKVIAKELIGQNQYRIIWINPLNSSFAATKVSSETSSVTGITPSNISGKANQISSCEVKTNGTAFKLNFYSIYNNGDSSSGITYSFPGGENLVITELPRPTCYYNIVASGYIKNNDVNPATVKRLNYSFYNRKSNEYRKLSINEDCNLSVGESLVFWFETSLYWKDSWEIYSKFVEGE